jgi:hypothetical protein
MTSEVGSFFFGKLRQVSQNWVGKPVSWVAYLL